MLGTQKQSEGLDRVIETRFFTDRTCLNVTCFLWCRAGTADRASVRVARTGVSGRLDSKRSCK
jgi:hypothetical protein